MEYRKLGSTAFEISAIGFGAWAIGGPAFAGDIPIGWGKVDDRTSIKAIHEAMDQGINFFDTADFYGLGHSEELLGKTLGNRQDMVVATKAGHRLNQKAEIFTDYSPDYLRTACEGSLRRLKRETIDLFQLHTAKVTDLKNHSCIEMLETLRKEGKIRYWGVSLNTWDPFPEAEYMIEKNLGNTFQLVLNIINQRALPLCQPAAAKGFGIIARMPLQFGLLTGKFTTGSVFEKGDHRRHRLTPELLKKLVPRLSVIKEMAQAYHTSPAGLSLGFILGFPEISTVIPGIKTPDQARENARQVVIPSSEDQQRLIAAYDEIFHVILEEMEQIEKTA